MGDADDWVDKAEEERLGIIAKYDKGREEGADIEPWDDPAFEIYHVTDHYGFIHDQRFPLKFNPEENKFRLIEAERADKWIKMSISWESKFKNSEKLRKRAFKGVPNKVRGRFWGLFLDLPTIKEQQKGIYEKMYQLARLHSLDVRQIDLDVNRTYRDNIMFRERYGVKQRSLFNILCAYSIYNSEVGYCQGMSQVAALLLTYMDEEDAFWGLSQLMTHPKYGMHGFFIAGFPKLVRYQKHHDKVLKTMLPKLKKHFDKHGVDVGLYTLKWFFQCFLDRVPFELALRLWDIYLLDGDKVLICAAYTILKIHQKQLLSKKSMDDLLDYLQTTIPSDLTIDIDKAIQTYQRCVEELHRKKIDTAGEASEDELPKKPFGLIENIVKPVPVRKEPRNSMKIVAPLNLPPEPTQLSGSELEEMRDEEEDEDEEKSEKASASHITVTSVTSAASSSLANSPRNFSRPLSSVSNFSYASAIEEYNSSSKSTPLKMNGVNSNKPKSMEHGNAKGSNSSVGSFEKEDHRIGNGSIETLESIELMDNQLVINVCDTMQVKFAGKTHSNVYHETRSEKVVKNPPAPPARSLDSKNHSKISTNIASTAKISHNGDNSFNDLNPNQKTSHDYSKFSPTSDKPLWSSSSSSYIPSGEAVRIHVPYSNSNISTVPVKSPQSGTPRSNFDTLKNDPNRIKIDISSK